MLSANSAYTYPQAQWRIAIRAANGCGIIGRRLWSGIIGFTPRLPSDYPPPRLNVYDKMHYLRLLRQINVLSKRLIFYPYAYVVIFIKKYCATVLLIGDKNHPMVNKNSQLSEFLQPQILANLRVFPKNQLKYLFPIPKT